MENRMLLSQQKTFLLLGLLRDFKFPLQLSIFWSSYYGFVSWLKSMRIFPKFGLLWLVKASRIPKPGWQYGIQLEASGLPSLLWYAGWEQWVVLTLGFELHLSCVNRHEILVKWKHRKQCILSCLYSTALANTIFIGKRMLGFNHWLHLWLLQSWFDASWASKLYFGGLDFFGWGHDSLLQSCVKIKFWEWQPKCANVQERPLTQLKHLAQLNQISWLS